MASALLTNSRGSCAGAVFKQNKALDFFTEVGYRFDMTRQPLTFWEVGMRVLVVALAGTTGVCMAFGFQVLGVVAAVGATKAIDDLCKGLKYGR